MKLTSKQITAAIQAYPLAVFTGGNLYRRAQAAFRRNLTEPGDCRGDFPLLAGLAIAEAIVGRGAGWIPEVQRIGCNLAKHITFPA